MTTADRLRSHLRRIQDQYPGIWRQVESFRAGRGRDLPGWPDWCYLPLAGAYAIATGGRDDVMPQGVDVAVIGALAAWRATQGVYRLHDELLDAVWETPVDQMPAEVLYQLPEWCVYVETPGRAIDGFYAHLERDARDGRPELRLLLDAQGYLTPIPLHLTRPTLDECLAAAIEEARTQGERHGLLYPDSSALDPGAIIRDTLPILRPILSVILYICAAAGERDIADGKGSTRQPTRPGPVKTKRGLREFAPQAATAWNVGWRMGAALGAARRAHDETADLQAAGGTHASPRPHIRRAHFHSFWSGPMDGERKLAVRWLPPIPVRLDVGEIVPTVRTVQ